MRITAFASLLLFLLSCGAQGPMSESEERAAEKTARQGPGPEGGPTVPMNRKLIRMMSLDISVPDTAKAAEQAEKAVTEAGGYVFSSSMQLNAGVPCFEMSLRIPSDKFGTTISSLKALATRILRESQDTEDVTEQYVDHEARLASLKATEQELTKLLMESREKNRDVEDIMKIYQQISQFRTQIESIEGRLKFLDRQVEFSTIALTIRPDESAIPVVEKGWNPSDTFRQAGRGLVSFLKFMVDALIYFGITLVPILFIFGIPMYAAYRILRSRGSRNANRPPGS